MEMKYTSNKAFVAFLLRNGVKPVDVALGNAGAILFGYRESETAELYKEWKKNKPKGRR